MGYLDKKPPLFFGIDEMLALVVKIRKKKYLWGKKFLYDRWELVFEHLFDFKILFFQDYFDFFQRQID